MWCTESEEYTTKKKVIALAIVAVIALIITIKIAQFEIEKAGWQVKSTVHETVTATITEVSVNKEHEFPRVEFIVDKDQLVYVFYQWDVYKVCKDKVGKQIEVEYTTITYKNGEVESGATEFIGLVE